MDDLLAHLGPPVAFISEDQNDALSPTDVRLTRLLGEADQQRRQSLLAQQVELVRYQQQAADSLAARQLGVYDGLVPAAGTDLDPTTAARVSASRLETCGACPRRFFFRYGLGAHAPDQWIVDHERWLDPLQIGNLLHGLFEQFLRDLTQRGLVPDARRDRKLLLDRLNESIIELRSDIPIPNEDAFRRTRSMLEETCEIFLVKEEEYCRNRGARPWVLEASLGIDQEPASPIDCRQPIPLTLSDGRVIRVQGRLDRIDQLATDGSQRYAIWDYKSGSSYGFDSEAPFKEGRKLQPFLYVGMLRHRIASSGGRADDVESFGYFFPNPREEGLRLQWTWAQLQNGNDIVKHICDLVSKGVFTATTSSSDCEYCDYAPVCGDTTWITQQSLWKAQQASNTALDPLRKLRGIEVTEEPIS
jgi:ATP-dependent helicase/nuclease subunit B